MSNETSTPSQDVLHVPVGEPTAMRPQGLVPAKVEDVPAMPLMVDGEVDDELRVAWGDDSQGNDILQDTLAQCLSATRDRLPQEGQKKLSSRQRKRQIRRDGPARELPNTGYP